MTPSKPTGFHITEGKGFHVTFENGWTVSVQFGPGNYSGNYDAPFCEEPVPASSTAEVAVWGGDGNMITMPDGDTVAGWQTPDQVLAIMVETASRAPVLQGAGS